MLEVRPLPFDTAAMFVKLWHRHHVPPQGHKFSIGAERDGRMVGIAIVGRPVSRHVDDGRTLEVTRLCTLDDSGPNVVSFLLGRVTRAASGLGYKRVVTYILQEESGVSLRASGFKQETDTTGGSWSCQSRTRTDKHPLGPKIRYSRTIT